MRKFRVWYIINPPGNPLYLDVRNPREGYEAINRLADSQLRDSSIDSNVFGLEELTGNGWGEWFDSEGDDVYESFEKRGPVRKGGDKPPPRRKQPPSLLPRPPYPDTVGLGSDEVRATTSQGVPVCVEVRGPRSPYGGTVLEAFGGNASVYLVFTHQEVKRLIERLLETL